MIGGKHNVYQLFEQTRRKDASKTDSVRPISFSILFAYLPFVAESYESASSHHQLQSTYIVILLVILLVLYDLAVKATSFYLPLSRRDVNIASSTARFDSGVNVSFVILPLRYLLG